MKISFVTLYELCYLLAKPQNSKSSRYTTQFINYLHKVCCATNMKFVRIQADRGRNQGGGWLCFQHGQTLLWVQNQQSHWRRPDASTTSWILHPLRTLILGYALMPPAIPSRLSPPLCAFSPNLPELDWGRWLRHQKLCLTVDQNSRLTGESLIPHRLPLHPHSRRFAIPSSSPAPLH